MTISSIQLVLLVNGLALVSVAGDHTKGLPKPLSDMTATLVDKKIYIAGGCDAPNGNVYNDETKFFDCGSISKSFYAFDVETEMFETLEDMPSARWRHAAAAANNKIYLHGGRAVDGYTSIPELHVFDVASGKWSEFTGLDAKYNLSDHTGFTNGNYVYFSGGYLEDYTTVGTTFRIDATAETPVPEDMAPMSVPRGDIAGTFTDDYAIVAGGFTDQNNFCEPHNHGERYWFSNNSWTDIANMTFGGAERVLVHLTEGVFAIGGESVPDNNCEPDALIEPGDKATTLDAMERYDVATDTWTTLADLPEHRFRFAGVGLDNNIYTFGGQAAFDGSCNCHPTTDLVIIYTEKGDGNVTERIVGGGETDHSSAFKPSDFIALLSSMAAIFMALA